MDEDFFNIYLDRLQGGKEEHFTHAFAPTFMDIHEADLEFKEKVFVEGSASIAQDAFVLYLNAVTVAEMSCAVCNKPVQVKIEINETCFSEEIRAIKSGIFNYKEFLRESILLELPFVAECNNGSCEYRKNMAEFLSKRQSDGKEEEVFYPFADL